MEALPRLAAEGRAGLGLTQLFLCPFPVHRPPEGAQGARVTQLPSLRLVVKELSGRHGVSVPPASALPPGAAPAQHQLLSLLTCCFPLAQATTLDAGSLEMLLQRQAQVRVT